MTKVRLTLVSASGVEKKETMKALAALYQKPEEHFEPHCEHLFDLKQPFTLLQQVEEAVAEQHREKLVEIGIQCEVLKLGNAGGLSLVPVDAAETEKAICPSCEQPTEEVEICDHCGVIMKKFAEQKAIDEKLQNKIAAAERTEERIKAAQLEAAKQLKEKKKKPVKPAPVEPIPDEEDKFTIKAVEKNKNAVLYAVAACALITAVGGGYLVHTLKENFSKDDTEYDLVVDITDTVSEPHSQTVKATEELQPLVELADFQQWRTRHADIKTLKHQLDLLSNRDDMEYTMSGLINSEDDPLVNVVAKNYSAQLHLQKLELETQQHSDNKNLESSGKELGGYQPTQATGRSLLRTAGSGAHLRGIGTSGECQ